MIKPVLCRTSGGGGGGGGGGGATASMIPPGDGGYGTNSVTVALSVGGTGVSKLRYKNGSSDSWHVVNALTQNIGVFPTVGGKTVSLDALASDGATVMGSDVETYYSGGG